MKLIFALGNPGDAYAPTRHNFGFRVLDAVAQSHDSKWQAKDKFKSLVAEATAGSDKVILVKPQTYYNEVGRAARAIADFYKLDTADILVVHDDLALPFGTIRTRIGGSPAGNNGIRSLNAHLGPDTARLRLGIYNDLRDQIDDSDFVLSKFTKSETAKLPDIIDKAVAIIDGFASDNFEVTTQND